MKIADYLEITEIKSDGSQYQIPLNSITSLTIGRSQNCDFRITGMGDDKISRIQATIYSVKNKERGHNDYYVRDGGVKSGRWVPSRAGIWSDGTKLSSEKGHRLGPGAEIDLVPQLNGYRCLLEWPAEKEDDDDTNPTVGFQNRLKREQIEARDKQIEGLKELANKLNGEYKKISEQLDSERKNFDAKMKSQADEILSVNSALNVEQTTNEFQNRKQQELAKKLDQLRKMQILVSGVVVLALTLSFGVEVEELKTLFEIVAGASALGGVAYSVSQS